MGGLSQAHMVVAAGAALDGIVSTRRYRAPAIVERNETDGFRRVARREEEPEPERWRRRVTPPRAKTPLHVSIFPAHGTRQLRSEEHTSELQSLLRTQYDVFCLTTQ